jgi:hypothetical protein
MKTVVQELIEWLDSFEGFPADPTRQNVKEKCWQMLETERQHLIHAYNKGSNDGIDRYRGDTCESLDGEDYYNEIYDNEQ